LVHKSGSARSDPLPGAPVGGPRAAPSGVVTFVLGTPGAGLMIPRAGMLKKILKNFRQFFVVLLGKTLLKV